MDGREGGYIKLYRRLKSWPLWRAMPVTQRAVWIELLLCAAWRDSDIWCGSRQVTVRRGQLMHAESEIAAGAKVGRQVVRDALEKLTREGAITREKLLSGNHSPWLITVVNYERFQGDDEEENPRPQQPGTIEEPKRNQRGTIEEPHQKKERREEGKKETLALVADAAPRNGVPTGEAIAHWCAAWERAGRGKHRSLTQAEGATVKRLVKSLGLDGFKARVDRAFTTDWFLQTGDLMVFAKHSEKFAPAGRAAPPAVTELT